MAKTIIHYFSGTGNTAHSVNKIAEQLQSVGHEVKIVQIKKDVLPSDEVCDYQIIAFPVLSWSAPAMVKQYVKQMHKSKSVKTAVLAVNGALIYNGKLLKGYTGQALEQIEHILKRKGYNVFLTGNASFPDNWTQTTNPCSKQDAEQIIPLGEAEVKKFTENFLVEKRELYRCGTYNKSWSYITAVLFGVFGRRILGKFYIADEHCTGCAICAKTCPAQTIKMENKKPYWGIKCEDCNRCINICPEKAIQVSVPLFIIQSIINIVLTVWAIWAVVIYTPQIIRTEQLYIIGIETVLIILAVAIPLWLCIGPLDAFFRLLSSNLSVRRFFSKSYTQKYRRYSAPGFNPMIKNL